MKRVIHSFPMFEHRRNPRAQLHLPVRLRWRGPLGTLVETAETLDIAREGMLISRPEACSEGSRVWVTFPFDPDATLPQPETPGRVVRVKATPTGGYLVAVHFEPPPRPTAQSAEFERRRSPRIPLSTLIRLRADDAPWPEETMTLNLSERGSLVETTRIYSIGDLVRVALPCGEWASAGEFQGRVVRIEAAPDRLEQNLALTW